MCVAVSTTRRRTHLVRILYHHLDYRTVPKPPSVVVVIMVVVDMRYSATARVACIYHIYYFCDLGYFTRNTHTHYKLSNGWNESKTINQSIVRSLAMIHYLDHHHRCLDHDR